MTPWHYTLRERFTPATGEGWSKYLEFSGFSHISELVSLDSMLCSDVIGELADEDWAHNVQLDYRLYLFHDADYLRNRQPLDPQRHQLLAVAECPESQQDLPAGFSFCGFDIVDIWFEISTLTNCGPMPEAFDPWMTNQFGLLPDRETAFQVRDRMRDHQPDDPHLGECEVWQVARFLPTS